MAKQPPQNEMNMSRRRLLAGIAGTMSSAAVTTTADGGILLPADDSAVTMPIPAGLPNPEDSGIDHIVVVMMENRSFDHYLGWVPGADGVQAGRSFVDVDGKTNSSHDLAPDFQNCAAADPNHSYSGGRLHYNNGAMDGFLKTAPAGDTFPIGYYTKASLPFFGPASENFTVCDRYFSGILSSTFPNRIYMHAGQTDRLSNTSDISKLPTIWDRLKAKGRRGEYVFSDAPIVALWGAKYLPISLPLEAFRAKAAAGLLADVTYIDPRQLGEGQGVSCDDHPLADIRNGQAFLDNVYNILRLSPAWKRTLLIINYDEWGGFADHVPPPLAPVSDAERTLGNDGRLGFRVPCMIIGPHARRGHVEHTAFDPNSILNLITWRFGLDPIGVRAASSNNLALALDFSNPPNVSAPRFDVEHRPYGLECALQQLLPQGTTLNGLDAVSRSRAEHILELQMVRTLAQRYGFPV